MDENKKRGDALRVNGAFTAPGILIAEGNVELSQNIDKVADLLYKEVSKEVNTFLKKYDVVEYILSHDEIVDAKILQCLSYIDLDDVSEAKKIANNQISLGDKGRFVNEDKGFFELVLLYDT